MNLSDQNFGSEKNSARDSMRDSVQEFASTLKKFSLRPPHALLLTSTRFGEIAAESSLLAKPQTPRNAEEESPQTATKSKKSKNEFQNQEQGQREQERDQDPSLLSVKEIASIASTLCGFEFAHTRHPEHPQHSLTLQHPDFCCVDPERKLLRLEELSPIRERIIYPPQSGKKRLILIDKAQRLGPHAANALLKSLEEPMGDTLFVLTAPSTAHVLPTISSRCVRLQMGRFAPLSTLSTLSALPASEHFDERLEPAERGFLQELVQGLYFSNPSLETHAPFNSYELEKLAAGLEKCELIARKYTAPLLIEELLKEVLALRRKHYETYESHQTDETEDHHGHSSPSQFSHGLNWLISKLRHWQTTSAYNPSAVLRLSEMLIPSIKGFSSSIGANSRMLDHGR